MPSPEPPGRHPRHTGRHPTAGTIRPQSPGASPAEPLIENPSTGERIMIRETAEQTGGERLTFELFLSPRGRVPAGHIHPRQVETFTVLRGRMRFRRGLRVLYAGPGESVTMPPGTFHTFLNPGDEPAQVVVQTSPALRMEEMLRAGAELGRRRALGLSRWRWAMEGVAFLREYRVEVAPPLVPAWALALVAQLAGKGQRPRPLPAATPARPSQAGFQP